MKTRLGAVLLLIGFAGHYLPGQTPPAAAQQVASAEMTTSVAADVRANTAAALTMTLPQAVELALEVNPLRRAALADQQMAAAGVREAKAALWPHVLLSESAMLGNDPVYAFGTRLRQGRFTAQDFALNQLNHPEPMGNFATRFGGQWNLLNAPDWLNVRRAEKINEAAARQLDRAGQQTVLKVVTAYYGLLLALKQQQTAELQQRTAQSVLELSQVRYDSGTVVEADLLAAQVNQAARRLDLVRAQNAVSLARVQLANAIGLAKDVSFEFPEDISERNLELPPLAETEELAVRSRPDLKKMQAQVEAADVGSRMAKSAIAPRVSAFAGWEQDNPALFSGGNNNWTAGLEVQIDLFTGGQKTAQLQRARAAEAKVTALRQAASDDVRLEVRKAWYEADSLRQQVTVMKAAVAQSEESLRIIQTRYQSGLTTITDLLRAEESRRRTNSDYWQAVCGFQSALANLELATGTLSPESAVAK